MPRSVRIEYPGAVYHVLNRGNYRQPIFATDVSKETFLATLWAACQRYRWTIHAYCLMDNHYHLAIETEQANLSVGMQWLQATFANRFNRNARERGHLFQGRFKALVVEQDEYLGPLIHYIHLNPVRARLVSLADLGNWRWSSLWQLLRKGQRASALNAYTGLYYAGHLADTQAGHKAYLGYLEWLVESNQARKEAKFRNLCRGWALGTREFRKALIERDIVKGLDRAGRESAEARQLHWEGLLEKMLSFHGKSGADVAAEKKSADWKVMIAYHLKRHKGVPNGWLSSHLRMGSCAGVSRYVTEFERAGGPKGKVYRRMSAKIKT